MSQLFASGGQSIVAASASASVLPNEYSGLISFRIDWLDLLAVQGTLKSLLQHHSLKGSINSSALSLPYGPTLTPVPDYWKTIGLTIWISVGNMMSLLFNTLSRFVIAILPRSRCFNSVAAVAGCCDSGAQEKAI